MTLCQINFFAGYTATTRNVTRIIKKTFSIKMEEDVGMSEPKKYANKVGRLT